MDEHGYSLVMPFVIVESEGGQYDDRSFVAGWECAHVRDLLRGCPRTASLTVHVGSIPQLDLIAMEQGYTMSADMVDDFAHVTFGVSSCGEARP